MSDFLLENTTARKAIKSLGLPLPVPTRLRRAKGPMEARPLHDVTIVVGEAGDGQLRDVLATTLPEAGASTLVTSQGLLEAFGDPGEAYGRHPRLIASDALPEGQRASGLVFDATAVVTPADLEALYAFFHPLGYRLASNGRIVILARQASEASNAATAAARAAIEGFVRSLAKEVGKRGSTAQLVTVAPDSESRVPGVLRFLLSKRSAFVSGQPLHICATAKVRGATQDVPWTRPLEGKVALVTGAARGIGAATAKLLADEGAHVVCLDRPQDDGLCSQVARDIGGSVLLADVSEPEAAASIASTLKERHGGLDIVVHNAGITRDKTLGRMKPEQWAQVLNINLAAIVRMTEALLDGVLRDNGRIVLLSSVSGIAGNIGQTNYSASKAGVMGFTRHLATQVATRGITVNAIAPGFIETRMTAAIPLMIRQAARRLSNLGQGGLPRDVGDAITFLSTPGALGLTGNVIRVCGGSLAGA